MCYLKFGIIFIIVVLAGSASSFKVERYDNFKHGDKCTPGQVFNHHCNTCICSEDGNIAACTSMFCIDYIGEDEQRTKRSNDEELAKLEKKVLHISGYSFGDECPAETFYNDCNLCICGNDGTTAACTLKYCGFEIAKKAGQSVGPFRINRYSGGSFCQAGQTFNDGCNACFCSANGLSAACTLKACYKEEEEVEDVDAAAAQPTKSVLRAAEETFDFPHIDDYKFGDSCPAGKMFFSQCNLCHCSTDGKFAACTLAYCWSELLERRATMFLDSVFDWPRIDNYMVGETCPAGKMFFNRCNVCRCSRNGASALCTNVSCGFME